MCYTWKAYSQRDLTRIITCTTNGVSCIKTKLLVQLQVNHTPICERMSALSSRSTDRGTRTVCNVNCWMFLGQICVGSTHISNLLLHTCIVIWYKVTQTQQYMLLRSHMFHSVLWICFKHSFCAIILTKHGSSTTYV